jgi:hypothetical protein
MESYATVVSHEPYQAIYDVQRRVDPGRRRRERYGLRILTEVGIYSSEREFWTVNGAVKWAKDDIRRHTEQHDTASRQPISRVRIRE